MLDRWKHLCSHSKQRGVSGGTRPAYILTGGVRIHKTSARWMKKGKDGCVCVSVSARALRSDCLFKTVFWSGATGNKGRGCYGTIQVTQTSPNTPVCYKIKRTLIQNDQDLKEFRNACQIVTMRVNFGGSGLMGVQVFCLSLL